MRCYRKILFILYKDHVTNEEVRAKIQLAFGPQEDLLTIIKKHKLQWYWHVSRLSGLAKTILQGTVKGEEDKADRGRGGKTTSGNGQAWSSPSPRGQWRTGKNGGNWLWNHLWCPNDSRRYGINDDDDRCLCLQVDVYAVYTDARTYVCTSLSVHTCVCENMHTCVYKYVYTMTCLCAY